STASDTHLYAFSVTGGNLAGAWNTSIQYFRGPASGTPLLTKTTDWGGPESCPAPPTTGGPLIARNTLIWPASSGTLNKKVEYCYDTNSNTTATKMCDYRANGDRRKR